MSKASSRSLLLFALGASVACSTVGEVLDPRDSSAGYQSYVNLEGEKVYRRVRPAPTPTPTPYPYATATPFPAVYFDDSPSSSASARPGSRSTFNGGAEIGTDGNHAHIGAYVLARFFPPIDFKFGVSLFKATDVYAGFDLGARPTFMLGEVAVFAGAGLYAGDSKRCFFENGNEVCEKKFLYAGYTELGATLGFFSVFARNYNIEEAGKALPSTFFYGVGLQGGF